MSDNLGGRVPVGDGVALLARVDGPEHAPWLVLSNSLATDHTMWDPQMVALTRAWRVLRYDTRGHGGSDAPDAPYDFDLLVTDVAALMDHHGIGRAAFMGLSLGGMTGLGLALSHPDRVSRLVCCDARADAPDPFVRSWDERVAAIEQGGMAAILPSTIERWLLPATRARDPERAARLERMILATPVAGYRGCAAALRRLDYLRHLPRIAAPALFVVGDQDGGAPPAAMRAMAEAVPGAAFRVVPDAAHLANLDNPAGFEDAVGAFLGLGPRAQTEQ